MITGDIEELQIYRFTESWPSGLRHYIANVAGVKAPQVQILHSPPFYKR